MKTNILYSYLDTTFIILKPVNSLIYHIEFYDKNGMYVHTDYSRTLQDIKNTYIGYKKYKTL